jgi:hypothetical protein
LSSPAIIGITFSKITHFYEKVKIIKKEYGYDLTVESSVFFSKEWEGPIIPGYRGFLERIRFALDPGVVPGEQVFYFGLDSYKKRIEEWENSIGKFSEFRRTTA